MMEYRRYTATVEFDESVGRLHGRVVNSGAYPIATFEATDVDGIRRGFHRSVESILSPARRMASSPGSLFQASFMFDSGRTCINALHARRPRAA